MQFIIRLATTTTVYGTDTLGQLYDREWGPVYAGVCDMPNHRFYNITVEGGYVGVNYDFAFTAYPIELISKRMLLNTGTGIGYWNGASSMAVSPQPNFQWFV
jgi:hypothetical protein